ncbi:MAG TPA: YIP1 family protein [Longimicrobiaceae bacterium]|nr:YIP1 family protein [Longimicrobiaceae bacterium]
MARTLPERMIGAAMLDVSVYEEVEADTTATSQAAIVVGIVAVAGAIGAYNGGVGPAIGAIITAFLGWILWAVLTWVIGTKVFKGTADIGEMLRTLGFAQSPGVLLVLGIIPVLGSIIAIVVGIWQIVTAVIAIRQALDFDTGKAILTAIISAIIIWVIMVFVVLAIVGTMFGVAAVAGAAG